jgi:agmatinase
MSYIRLYTSPSLVFSGQSTSIEEADYVLMGVPFDFTSTYRPGSRFGPSAIRDASLNIETYSLRTEIDVSEVKVCDIGDLHITDDLEETVNRVKLVTKEIIDMKKIPIVLGGEHAVIIGAIKAFKDQIKDLAILDFDAHMDLRQEYLGATMSHATCMRRICDLLGARNIVEVGVRDVSKEELEFARRNKISFYTSNQITNDFKLVRKEVIDRLSNYKHVYVTIDMDVLDPSYAPAVGNPAPEGLNPSFILETLHEICHKSNVVGFDLVEVAPHYDSGTTAIQAAHIIFDMLCFLEKYKR